MTKRLIFVLTLLAMLPTLGRTQTEHGRIKADRISNKATIIITGATPDVSGGNVFKTNNVAPTTITNFLNGVDSQVITINCGETNTTIQNNANIVTSGAADIPCTVNKAQDFTYDAAQAKWVQKSGGAASSGASPAGNNGDLQSKNGSLFQASGINDNTKLPGYIRTGRPEANAGPDHTVDILAYGGYITSSGTTVNTTSGSTSLALTSAQNFRDGEYFTISRAGTACTLSTPVAPTVTPSMMGGGYSDTVTTAAGARAYSYKIVAIDTGDCRTVAGSAGTTATGNTLGIQGAVITSLKRIANSTTFTATTSSAHGFTTGQKIYVKYNITDPTAEGWSIATVTDSTRFTYPTPANYAFSGGVSAPGRCTVTNTALTSNIATITCANTLDANLPVVITGTTNGGGVFNGSWMPASATGTTITFVLEHANVTSAADTGTVTAANVWGFSVNHLSWTAVTNAFKYLIYGRIAGSEVLIGQSMFNLWDDYGAQLSDTGRSFPNSYSTTPPVATVNHALTGQIVSGGGTTTLVSSVAAGATLTGAFIGSDDGPALKAALNAAKGQSEECSPVYVHNSNPGGFGATISSYTDLSNTNCPGGTVLLNGSLNLSAPLAVTNTNLKGVATSTTGLPAFAQSNGPKISVQSYPGIHIKSQGNGTRFENLSIVSFGANSTNGDLLVFNQGIVQNWTNINWGHFGPGALSMSMIADNPTTGFSFYFIGGTVNSGGYKSVGDVNHIGLNPFPDFVFTGLNSANATSNGIYISGYWITGKGGFNLEMNVNQGVGFFTVENTWTQSLLYPLLSVSGPFINGIQNNITIRDVYSADHPTAHLTSFGLIKGTGIFENNNGLGPFNTGNPVIGASNNAQTFQRGSQRIFGEIQEPQLRIGDGVVYTGIGFGPAGYHTFSEPVSIADRWPLFTADPIPTAPTCTVSAGGSTNIGTYPYTFAPVWQSGGEGTKSFPVTCTTTSGQQTVTINWTRIPGAIGYNLYQNGLAFLGGSPMVTSGLTTQYVLSVVPNGNSESTAAGAGSTTIQGGSVNTQTLRFGATNSGGTNTITFPTATANRSQTLPNASGVILLDTTAPVTAISVLPAAYDTFNRTNGGLGTNWTTAYGSALQISSNQVAPSSSTQGAFWNAATLSADQFSEANVSVLAGFAGVTVRMVSPGNGYICLELVNIVAIYKLTTGNIGSALATSSPTTSAFDTIRLEVSGTTLTCRMNGPNGSATISTTDSSYANGSPGINSFFTGSGSFIDNWNGGNLNSIPRLNSEQDWSQPQHFTQPVTIGTMAPIAGALAAGTLYVSHLIAGGATTQSKLKTADANGNIVDVAGSGTLGITIPSKPWFPAGVCDNATPGTGWHLPSAAAPTKSCRTGTNINEMTLDFADADSAQLASYPLPSDFTGAIDAKIIFFSPDTSGTVIFQIATACQATSGSGNDDLAFNTADSFATVTLNATANAQWSASKTGINITGCDPNDTMQVKISRTTDTATSRARVKGVELTMRRAL